MAGDVSTGLVGYWPLNETSGIIASDFAGGDDPGTLINNPTWTVAGRVHGGLVLNGTNQSISVPYSTRLDVGARNIVVSAWIKTTSANGTIISQGQLSNDHIALQVVGGKARFQFNPGGGPFGVTGTKTVNDGNWHLVTGVRTGVQSGTLYVDGVLDGTFNLTGSFTGVNATTPLLIGASSTGGYFNGAIDDVRFYNDRIFDANDAAALYALRNNPITVADSYVFLSQTTTIDATAGVLKNDSPRDDRPLTASIISNATRGTVTLNADGSFVYVPQNGFAGNDSFTYRASDGVADPIGATVSIRVVSTANWNTIGNRVRSRAMNGASSITASTVSGITTKLNADGSFNDLTYASNTSAGASALRAHASRLATLARAYQYVGGPMYLNATLKQQIIDGYTYLAYSAPNSLSVPNWFDTKIAIPEEIWPGLVAMKPDLTSTLVNDVVAKYFDLATVWDEKDLSGKNGGANLTSRAVPTIARAVLKGDPSDLPAVVDWVSRDLNSQGYSGSGLQPDNSFSQHTSYPAGTVYQGGPGGYEVQNYAGSYGMVYADDLSYIMPWLHGTSLAFDSAAGEKAVGYFLDGQGWLFRNDAIETTSNGRAITRKGQTISAAPSQLRFASGRLQALGIRTSELDDLEARLNSGSTSTNFLSGNKSFYTTDMMVQQRQGYMASVRMLSQRTIRPETLQIPGGTAPDGSRNFFLADGVTTLFRDGTEYGSTSGQEIFPVWNWARLPGTTLEQLSDAAVNTLSVNNAGASGGAANVGTGVFVGSVSNGNYGAAAMDYGRTLGSVTAKKGYFYFDEGFIALGAGINAPSATNPVNTTLNQTTQSGSVTVKAADGSTTTLNTGTTQSFTNPKWILHGGVGYMLLGSNGTVTAQALSQTGTWEAIGTATPGTVTKNVFTAWIDHGNTPSNGRYAYAVLPGANSATLDGYAAANPFTVLSNSPQFKPCDKRVQG